MTRQIFISYTRDDEQFAKHLADTLCETGANVWLDIYNARPGRHWARSIEQALAESKMMIVVLSPAALESAHIAVEWQAYLEAYRPVIPVMSRRCDPPGPLRTRRPVDFTREQNFNRAFHELTNRLLEYGTRIRRSDPVIWTLSEGVNDYRDERESVTPCKPSPTGSGLAEEELASSGLKRMVQGLRDMLRRGDAMPPI
ncbi:MAG: toll/interleukin-1 receptor domain-containing protein [Chloroflexi bacterium]|nr:toll/interleukin-1 receptor domain-containing protein [Chloroflexota bacterium]